MAREVVTSENREEFIAKKLAQKMGKKAEKAEKEDEEDESLKGKDIGKFLKKYLKNEDKNYHTENVVELARFFGDKDEEKNAKDIMKRHLERGFMDEADYDLRKKINDKYWPKISKHYDEYTKSKK